MRAAAFSYGILTEFDRIPIRSKNTTTRLIDHVDFLSGVPAARSLLLTSD